MNCVPSIEKKYFCQFKNHNKKQKTPFKEKYEAKATKKTFAKKDLFKLIKWRNHGQTRPSSR